MSRDSIRFSLRFKFILLISAMFFLMALMLSLFFFTRTQNLLHDKLIEKGTILVKDLAYNSIYGLSIGDAEVVDILIQGIIEQPDVSFVVVYGPDGREIAVKDLAKTRWPLARDEMPRILASNGPRVSLYVSPKRDSFYEITAPVSRKDQNQNGPGGIGSLGGSGSRDTVIGAIRVGFSLKAMNQELRTILWFSLLLTGGVIGIGMVIATFFIRRIIQPVTEMALAATRISDGDFTWEVQVRSSDEVGILGKAFNRMLSNLKGVIGKIQEASNQIVSTARQLGLSSNNVTEGAQVQAKSIESISTSIEEINTAVRDVARTIDLLSSSSEASSSSVLEMDASINEVAKNTGVLESSIEETSSSILEMSTSIQQVAEHANLLFMSVEQTLTAAQEIDASVAAVAVNAKKSALLSRKVREEAEKMGLDAVQKTIEGMDHIRETMSDLVRVVNRLGERSEQIGGILAIIDEVTEQTGLLALNAAILAAQSGDHGRGFSVVAGEIKDLAERTAASTKEIAQLIGDVQSEVGDAVLLTRKGIGTVEEGVLASNESETVLRKILERAEESREMAKQIEMATVEQAQGIRQVTEAIQKNSDMVHQVTEAAQAQKIGTERIMEATQRMREISKIVRQAMTEQARGSKQIAETVTHVSTRVQEIAGAMNEQTRESQKIIYSIEKIRDITKSNVSVASEMASAVNTLARQSETLEEQIRDFKV